MKNNLRDFLLKDKPHIKKYKKARKIHGEIIDSMMRYFESPRYKENIEKQYKEIIMQKNNNVHQFDTFFDTRTQLGVQALANVVIYKNIESMNCITEEFLKTNRYKKKEKEVAEKFVKSLATKTPGVDQLVVNLSGGNQQKVVIAKWLTRNCDILIFDEPTRGIDVGAKNEIYKLMNQLAAEGKAIIMVSSEMTEILRMSDRIVVMCEGKKTGELDISEATQENIMNMATREIN